MAKSSVYASQSYPRITDEMDKYFGFLDESKLKAHSKKVPYSKLRKIIADAITYASKKSSRVILNIPEGSSRKQKDAIYKKQGRALFAYFIRYCGDPASTAHDSLNRHYSKVAVEQFRNRTVQKERMNSGWRYQYIAKLPFFLNYKHEEIMKAVLEVLIEQGQKSSLDIEIPVGIIDSFGEECRKRNLLDDKGNFNDAFKLVDLFL